ILANVVELLPLPLSSMLGHDQIESDEDAEALRAPAELARSLGVAVERLRVRSPRPVDALLELVAEREPALLVLRPDRARARALEAHDRGQLAARAEDRRGDRVQVGLALADRLRVALAADALQLRGQTAPAGDRPLRVRLQRAGRQLRRAEREHDLPGRRR